VKTEIGHIGIHIHIDVHGNVGGLVIEMVGLVMAVVTSHRRLVQVHVRVVVVVDMSIVVMVLPICIVVGGRCNIFKLIEAYILIFLCALAMPHLPEYIVECNVTGGAMLGALP